LNVDVAVIGAGSAGIRAYRGARQYTENVVLIEGGPYGTTCARVGCMSSKLLIAASEAAHAIRQAPAFGIHPGDKTYIDGMQVMKRVRDERDRFVDLVLKNMEDILPEHRLHGYARFLNDHALQIDDHSTVEAKSIVIATGSSPFIPSHLHELGDRLLVSEDVFEWQDLPSSVAVFGSGFIGLELGQAFHRLGIKSIVLGEKGFVGPLSDPVIRSHAAKIFGEEFYIDPYAKISMIKKKGNEVIISFKDRKGNERLEGFDYVLAATGRMPNVRDLCLENTSMELDIHGVPLFNSLTLQCGDTPIFIAGDANNDYPRLPKALDEGPIAGENAALFPNIFAGDKRPLLMILFSDPQIAIIGNRYEELREGTFATGAFSFEGQGRSRIMLKNRGLLHVYAEHGTGLFMGAEMFGPCAEHIGHLLAWALQQKMTISQMLKMPFYHPVIEGAVHFALEDAHKALETL
jgi:dihydrolipoamide dehydrogenase